MNIIWGQVYCYSKLSTILNRTDIPTIPLHKSELFKPTPRKTFNIPTSAFAFLFTFSDTSVLDRKNPSAIILAFKQAFPDNPNVCLVLKLHTLSTHKNTNKELLHFFSELDSRIIVITENLERPSFLQLLDNCDCYISLHRSEGTGLKPMEAMALKNPSLPPIILAI